MPLSFHTSTPPERFVALIRVLDGDGRRRERHEVILERCGHELVPAHPYALGGCLATLRRTLQDGDRVLVEGDGPVPPGVDVVLAALADRVAGALAAAPAVAER